jgi:hypothetical protein
MTSPVVRTNSPGPGQRSSSPVPSVQSMINSEPLTSH